VHNIEKKIRIIRLIFHHVFHTPKIYRLRIALAFLFIIGTIGINISLPILFKDVVYLLQNQRPIYTVYLALASYAAIWVLGQITSQLREIVSYRFVERATNNFCIQIFQHLHALSHQYHLNRHTGSIINALERAQGALPKVFWGLCFFVIPTSLEVVFAAGILMKKYGLHVVLILLATIISYIIFTINFTKKAVINLRAAYQSHAKASAWSVDSLLNFETVKHFANEHFEVERFSKVLDEREVKAAKSRAFLEWIHLGQGIIIGLGLAVVTWIIGQKVIVKELDVSDFILVNSYFIQFAAPLSHLGTIFRNIREGLTNLESVVDILATQQIIPEIKGAHDLHFQQGNIEFRNLSFAYENGNVLFKDFNLQIKAGSSLGIVGTTGTGKSSLVKLLMRFYDPNSGQILIDDQDIKGVTLKSLRVLFGLVPQDIVLFNTTLRENIEYGKPGASFTEIQEAAKLANLSSFIERLPEGYETLVGERGLKLSGGEKQRVAIARMILKKPRIFLFDEATSSLDLKTEKLIKENLSYLSRGYTTLIIAHRLSTVQDADWIIFLDHGSIKEQGTHDELMKQKGLYYNLWKVQEKDGAG
jgi:ATP-binding cassette subfamily B protein